MSVPPTNTSPVVYQEVATSSSNKTAPVQKPKSEKTKQVEQKTEEVKTAPQPLVLTDELKSTQTEIQKSKTFTTPSGAVIDAFGNVLYAPPSATVESEIPQTPPLPQNSTPAPSQPYIPLPPDRTPDPTNRVGCNNQSCSLPDETLCRKVRYGNTAGTFAWYFCRANYPDLWK